MELTMALIMALIMEWIREYVVLFLMLGIFFIFLVTAFGTRSRPSTISGRCWVSDGDGIVVEGARVRLAGLDAPEQDQLAVGRGGRFYDQGEMIKRMLCKKIGGKRVEVHVNGVDRYGRVIGTVFLGDENINRMMVMKGWAIAAYDDTYKRDEAVARKLRVGMWGDKAAYDPRHWRYGRDVPIQ